MCPNQGKNPQPWFTGMMFYLTKLSGQSCKYTLKCLQNASQICYISLLPSSPASPFQYTTGLVATISVNSGYQSSMLVRSATILLKESRCDKSHRLVYTFSVA